MANSKQLRNNLNQHIVKNVESKKDDKKLMDAVLEIVPELNSFITEKGLTNIKITHQTNVPYTYIYDVMNQFAPDRDIDKSFGERTFKPDGGILFLQSDNGDWKKVILISEAKRQGTNDKRAEEGLVKQAQGNAIERLGKNLSGVRTLMQFEAITPFVVFGWGCDFEEHQNFVLGKVSLMNQMYPLNKTYVYKDYNDDGLAIGSPVSMYFREEKWNINEMKPILLEVAKESIEYYILNYFDLKEG